MRMRNLSRLGTQPWTALAHQGHQALHQRALEAERALVRGTLEERVKADRARHAQLDLEIARRAQERAARKAAAVRAELEAAQSLLPDGC